MEYMTTEDNASDSQFKHSIKVPMQYKKAAKVLKNSMEGGASIKGQIFAEKHAVSSMVFISMYHLSALKYKFLVHLSENKSFIRIDNKNFQK